MPLAQLDVDDAWVVETFGSDLISGVEPGLGPWVGTGARLPSTAPVEILRYELIGPLYLLQTDFAAPLREVLEEFILVTGLSPSKIRWRHAEA